MSDLTVKEMCELVTEIHMEQDGGSVFCNGCPLLKQGHGCLVRPVHMANNWDEIQKRLKDYKESKKITYKKDFLSKFPNAKLDSKGEPLPCRNSVYGTMPTCTQIGCSGCWNEELKAGESS